MDFKALLTQYADFLEQLFSQSKGKRVVGIDIGSSSIKAVEIVAVKDKYEIQNWAIELIDGNETKAALQRLLARMNVKDQMPVAAVSGKGTLIRYVEMPRMPIEDLRKSFTYEIDKYFPFDPQTIYTDCFMVESSAKTNKVPVLLVAVKKELVDAKLALFKEVGMELSVVTTNSIATANAFEKFVKVKEEGSAKAILDIGGAVSNLMILDKNHTPSFTRDLFVGSQEMTKQVASKLGITSEAANELKLNPGDKIAEVLQACEPSVQSLVAEIRLSLDYFKTEKNAAVTELFLVGGGSLLKGIDAAFEKSLNIPVKVWDPLANVALTSSVDASAIRTHSSQLGVAIGLALTKI